MGLIQKIIQTHQTTFVNRFDKTFENFEISFTEASKDFKLIYAFLSPELKELEPGEINESGFLVYVQDKYIFLSKFSFKNSENDFGPKFHTTDTTFYTLSGFKRALKKGLVSDQNNLEEGTTANEDLKAIFNI